MRLTVLAVGKLREAWVKEGCEEYARRVRGKLPFAVIEVKREAELSRHLPAGHAIWVLDERGVQFSSVELGAALKTAMDRSTPGITFVIGGADGLPGSIVERAHVRFSLGRLTLPHRLARLILVEQLYRALSIVRNEPYHRA